MTKCFVSSDKKKSRNFSFSFLQLRASICLLRGKVAEVLGSLQQAMKFYEEALRYDVFCAEAYEKLIKKHMFTPDEGKTSLFNIEYSIDIIRFRTTFGRTNGH